MSVCASPQTIFQVFNQNKTHWLSPATFKYVTLEHKTSLKSQACICSNNQKYIVWVKIIVFFLCQKSLGH